LTPGECSDPGRVALTPEIFPEAVTPKSRLRHGCRASRGSDTKGFIKADSYRCSISSPITISLSNDITGSFSF
jgi:hypothetical protein